MNEEKMIRLLKDDLENQARFIHPALYTEKIFSTIILELKTKIYYKRTIEMNADIFLVILNMYPELLKAFDENFVKKTIIEELQKTIHNGTPIHHIAKKYAISIEEIKEILKELKTTDFELYNQIKETIKNNQKQYEEQILIDIQTLNQIIVSLGPIKENSLTLDQKIKFSYLCGKYLHNSLEDIYMYNLEKHNENSQNIKVHNFLNGVLKFSNILRTETNAEKRDILIFNNGWLKEYNREEFFGMKDGKPTIEYKYGKKAETLTMNAEQVIVEMLKAENIPLRETIVKNAFREYFNDNLFEYISKLKEYDQEFEETKKKGKK